MISLANKFPNNFIWGASTSAYQVEGNNSSSDWWEWEKAGNTEPSGKACDYYNRFKEDFLLAKELGHNAHRLGIEWSRLEKTEGVWDEQEWGHYKLVVEELCKLNIKPIVTLHHFTLPLWLAHKGGWLNDDSVNYFVRFSKKAIEKLGHLVEYWITINEPNILAFLAYYLGQWPPCKRNFNEALHVLKNLLKGHIHAYTEMQRQAKDNTAKIKAPKIGIAHAVTAFHSCRRFSALDQLSTYYRAKLHNHGFIASAIHGKILIPALKREKLSAKNTIDFIGLNYYFRQFIHHQKPFLKNPFGEVCSTVHHKNTGKLTDMGWEIYPRGIYEVVKNFQRYHLPIIITENGLATTDDNLRKQYIEEHLTYLLKAMNEGTPVIGYLHWSLLDNFEWDKGYSKRFGLIDVDFNTQKRTIRDSARYLASIIKAL